MSVSEDLKRCLGISLEEAQCYLDLVDQDPSAAQQLFLLAQAELPLTLENVASICGVSPYEFPVNDNDSSVTLSQIPTRDLTHWRQVPFPSLSQCIEKCAICMFEFTVEDDGGIVQLGYCTEHYFHADCIEACRSSNDYVKCPVCGRAYGLILGDMPAGSLVVLRFPAQSLCLEGYPDTDTIALQYSMPSGERSGTRYSGTTRTAFFPASAEGLEVIRLLVLAFERRLTFTVGTSITTGRQNAVVWNGIHHKTNVTGGPTRYGYPDPGYFFRVKEELLSRGLT